VENNKKKKFLFIFLIIILYFIFYFYIKYIFEKKKTQNIVKENNLKNEKKRNDKSKNYFSFLQFILINEAKMPHLNEIIKKRIFKIRLPLPKEIKCQPHLRNKELTAFLSLLTNDTIFFETGSGCSSVIAKYYAKKTYAVEGCKKYYDIGIKNGLKEILLFNDLKPDNPTWSYPGKKSNTVI
jgi:Ca2+/Na+ antiporter